MSEARLWKVFSQYIRLRDADENGFCKCITCAVRKFWKEMDCGHGHGRQAGAIKYHEWNNHAQCGRCNLDGGRQDVYKIEVNKRYGPHAWDLLELATRKVFKKRSPVEIKIMTKYFLDKVNAFLKIKPAIK